MAGMKITRKLVMSVLAVGIAAAIINLALSFVVEQFPGLEELPPPLGEMASMLRMHWQAPLATSLLVAGAATLACLAGLPMVLPMLKQSAKAVGV